MAFNSLRQYNPDDLNVDDVLLSDANIKNQLSVELLCFKQIERCFLSSTQDELYFSANVRVLLSLCPSSKRSEIIERTDEYTSIKESWVYKYWCGVPLGSPQNPVNGSPAKVQDEVIDWHKLFEIILEALEDCGITWRHDAWTIEVGKVEKDMVNIENIKPTPVFSNQFEKPENLAQTEGAPLEQPEKLQKNGRGCVVCQSPIDKGEAVIFNKHLLHKGCLELGMAKFS